MNNMKKRSSCSVFTHLEKRRRSRLTVPCGNLSLTGFTLTELIIVIIIIGILAGISVPSFVNTREKAWDKEAIAGLLLVKAGNRQYYARNGMYWPNGSVVTCLTSIGGNLSIELPLGHWTYNVSAIASGATFIARAVRVSGTRTFTVNQAVDTYPSCVAGTGCL